MAYNQEVEGPKLNQTATNLTNSESFPVLQQNDNKCDNATYTAEETASVYAYGYWTFEWISGMFETGYSRALQLDDLNYLRQSDHSENLFKEFNESWKIQQNKAGNKPSVLGAIMRSFGKPFWISVPFKIVYDILLFSGPVLLGYFIEAAKEGNTADLYFYASVFFPLHMLSSFLLQQYFHRTHSTGMRARGCLLAALYDKILRISVSSRNEQTTGYIMNIITTDCSKIQRVFQYVLVLISAPFQITIAICLLYQQIQWSVFVGVAFQMFIMLPIQMVINMKTKALQKEVMKLRDSRLSVVNEVFGAIKVIKMYAWELSFGKKMSDIREKELKILLKYSLYYSFNVVLFMFASVFVNLCAFTSFIAFGGKLNAKNTFVSIALFNQLRFPLAMLPMIVVAAIEASVSLKRVRLFLCSTEVKKDQIEYVEGKSDLAISLRNATFYWDDKMQETALTDISCDFNIGSITMIIGRTGSGKSALLRSMLGDLNKAVGRILYYESPTNASHRISIGFSSQVAWIQNATVRENILFGQQYEQTFYNAVVRACALTDDLKIFPNGDMSEIGEKGINLSGGQKQRISLARAVYSNADVYIFDDPLSAVDVEVANHIFNQCLRKLLKNKTIILTTHAIKFLKYAHNIIVMKDSKIEIQGTLKRLQAANIDLAQFHVDEKKKEKSPPNDSVEKDDANSLSMLKSESLIMSLSSFDLTTGGDVGDDAEAKSNSAKLENRKVGEVGLDVYISYIKAMGGISLLIMLMFANLAFVSADNVTYFWLAKWSRAAKAALPGVFIYNWYYLRIYAGIILISLISMIAATLTLLVGRLRASRILHDTLLERMLHSSLAFFDENPLGRIINRFAKDMNDVDESLPNIFGGVVRQFLFLIAAIIRVIIVTPLFAVITIPLIIFYNHIQKYFISATRELRRLSSIMQSPIYQHFNESLNGVSVICALNKSKEFNAKNKVLINNDLKCYYPSIAANRWLGIRLEFIANCLVGGAAFCCAVTSPEPERIGIAITSIMAITQLLNWFIRQKAELEQDIVSVERINEYCSHSKQEKAFVIDTQRPRPQWPHNGEIYFNNVWMKYRKDLQYVLKGLTFHVNGGEKVGVIGRTGAGKSSLFMTLLRMVEFGENRPDSFIEIDGVNISNIGLQDLRSKISVIPQDPILFAGTIKSNLDPFNERNNAELMNSLKAVHIWRVLKKMSVDAEIRKNETQIEINMDGIDPLQFIVEENGSNFSVGQRQLLCFARAIIRNSKIILLDEATSSVDRKTDKLIQQTINEIFQKNTILTIAHRIDTILAYDRILIMDNGKILEYDSPSKLLHDKESKFTHIVKTSFGVDIKKIFDSKQ